MAFSINRITLLGNITKDPELRYTPSGQAVLSINLATNRSIKKNDAWEDVATFHRIIVWGKMAEYISKTVHKGSRVYVDGRVDNRSYEKDGQKHYISEVVAENVIPMSQAKATSSSQQAQQPAQEAQDPTPPPDGKEDVNPDDIPF